MDLKQQLLLMYYVGIYFFHNSNIVLNFEQNACPSPGPPPTSAAGQPQGPPPQGQENLHALQRAIDSMEEKGMQEDPRYSQLLALRARSNGTNPVFSQAQMAQLR